MSGGKNGAFRIKNSGNITLRYKKHRLFFTQGSRKEKPLGFPKLVLKKNGQENGAGRNNTQWKFYEKRYLFNL